MRPRLKKRYPGDHRNRTRWIWLIRTPTTDGKSWQSDTIGYFADSRDTWAPRPFSGRVLPRLTEAQARERLREFENKVHAGRQDKREQTPWFGFAESYIAQTRGTVRKSTLIGMEHILYLFGESAGVDTPRDVNPVTVKRFVQAQRDAGKRTATINKYVTTLKRIWNDRYRGQDNPFCGVPRLKVARKDWHLYTPDEIGRLLDPKATPDFRRRVRYLVMFSTGIRKGEAENLVWSDLDFDAKTLTVNPKQDTPDTWAWLAKDAERRTVPITDNVGLSLMRLKALSDPTPYVFIPKTRHEYIIGLRDAGRWSSTNGVMNNVRRDWLADCKRAGIPADELHSLRRSCVTLWLADNVPPHEVQRWAGHSSVETTIGYYSKVDRTAMDRARKSAERWTAGLVA